MPAPTIVGRRPIPSRDDPDPPVAVGGHFRVRRMNHQTAVQSEGGRIENRQQAVPIAVRVRLDPPIITRGTHDPYPQPDRSDRTSPDPWGFDLAHGQIRTNRHPPPRGSTNRAGSPPTMTVPVPAGRGGPRCRCPFGSRVNSRVCASSVCAPVRSNPRRSSGPGCTVWIRPSTGSRSRCRPSGLDRQHRRPPSWSRSESRHCVSLPGSSPRSCSPA